MRMRELMSRRIFGGDSAAFLAAGCRSTDLFGSPELRLIKAEMFERGNKSDVSPVIVFCSCYCFAAA